MKKEWEDPMERLLREGLETAGIEYVDERSPANTADLDFYLPEQDVFH